MVVLCFLYACRMYPRMVMSISTHYWVVISRYLNVTELQIRFNVSKKTHFGCRVEIGNYSMVWISCQNMTPDGILSNCTKHSNRLTTTGFGFVIILTGYMSIGRFFFSHTPYCHATHFRKRLLQHCACGYRP